jgi:hypothetical protein
MKKTNSRSALDHSIRSSVDETRLATLSSAEAESKINTELAKITTGPKVSERFLSYLHRQSIQLAPLTGLNNTEELFAVAEEMIENSRAQSETEAMLAAQIFTVHAVALECLFRSLHLNLPHNQAAYEFNRAMQLMKLFLEQTNALRRVQGKGSKQRVIVKHVQVNTGGQAFVGSIGDARKDNGER